MDGIISFIRWVFIFFTHCFYDIHRGSRSLWRYFYTFGDYSSSIAWCKQALRKFIGSDQAPILNNIGTGYMALCQQKKAFNYYSRAVAAGPSYDRGWINLGVTQEKLGIPDEAFQSYGRISGSNPEINADAMGKKETLLSGLGKLTDALFAFRQGESGASGQVLVDLYTGIGAIEFVQKNLEAAEKDFKKAINEDSQGEYADTRRSFETVVLHDKTEKTNAAVYLKRIQAMRAV
jgi:tetratricopeptide (TPR) repeat protein